MSEQNLLGRGLYAVVSWRRFQERRDLGARLGTTSFLGTRLDASVAGGSTRTGQFFNSVLAYPFVGEEGRVSVDVRALTRDHEQSRRSLRRRDQWAAHRANDAFGRGPPDGPRLRRRRSAT